MGTDIHGWIEFNDGSRWNHSMPIGLPDRDYRLFSLMAGVRCVCDPMFGEPRGLPSDVSWYGKEVYGDGIDHSASWLTLEELQQIYKLRENADLKMWIAAMEARELPTRLVFGFDS